MVENKMRSIRVEKIVINIATKGNPEDVKKAIALVEKVGEKKPLETKARKRIAQWKLRPGLPLGAMVTLRGKKALDKLNALLKAVDMKIKRSSFTTNGFSFGIREYIDIEGVKYDPKIGIIGLEASVKLARPGYRVRYRKLKSTKIPKSHIVTKDEAMEFAKTKLGIELVEAKDDEADRY